MVSATSKVSDQPAHMHSLIRAFASRLNILLLKLLKEHHLDFLRLKEAAQARLSLCQNATLLEITCHGLNGLKACAEGFCITYYL